MSEVPLYGQLFAFLGGVGTVVEDLAAVVKHAPCYQIQEQTSKRLTDRRFVRAKTPRSINAPLYQTYEPASKRLTDSF